MADFPDKTDYSRLRAWLSDSKINQTNNPLWQTISSLIKGAQNWGDFSKQTFSQVSGTSSAATGQNNITQTINNIINQFNNISGNYVTGPASAVDSQIAVFDGITGKIIKALGLTGILNATSGVPAAIALTGVTSDYLSGAGSILQLPIIRSSTTIFDDAAFKALPSAPVNLVAAPGLNKRIVPILVDIIANFSAGAYTNRNANGSIFCALANGETGYTPSIVNDAGIPLTFLNDFTSAGKWHVALPIQTRAEPTNDYGNLPFIDAITGLSYNVPFQIVANNVISGDFTGGDPANTMHVSVLYSIFNF